jgi:hypothetical protein
VIGRTIPGSGDSWTARPIRSVDDQPRISLITRRAFRFAESLERLICSHGIILQRERRRRHRQFRRGRRGSSNRDDKPAGIARRRIRSSRIDRPDTEQIDDPDWKALLPEHRTHATPPARLLLQPQSRHGHCRFCGAPCIYHSRTPRSARRVSAKPGRLARRYQGPKRSAISHVIPRPLNPSPSFGRQRLF